MSDNQIEIKLTIVDSPRLPEMLKAIGDALGLNGRVCACPGTNPVSVTVDEKPVEFETPKEEPAHDAVTAEPEKENGEGATRKQEEAGDVPDAEPAPAKKEYTFTQISNAGAALCTQPGKLDQLVQLLNSKYQVAAITMIDKSRYAELAEDLIALGAVIGEG